MLFPRTSALLSESAWAPWRSDQQRILYHYTTSQGLHGIVTQKKFRLTHSRHLNDETEGLHRAVTVDIALDRLRSTLKNSTLVQILSDAMKIGLSQDQTPTVGGTFLGCFSTLKDSLPQWRGYGRYDSSFAMAFDAEKLLAIAQKAWDGRCWLLPVQYDQEIFINTLIAAFSIASEEFDECIESNNPQFVIKALVDLIANYASALKHHAFKEENEWRLIFLSLADDTAPSIQHLPNSTFRPYVELELGEDFFNEALLEVVVGPQSHQKAMLHGAASFLREQTGREIPVVKSEVPYNSRV